MSEQFQAVEITEIYEAYEVADQQDAGRANVFERQLDRRGLLRTVVAGMSLLTVEPALTGCGDGRGDRYYADDYLDWMRRESESIPKQVYGRRSMAEWAADAKTADDATRPYARRLYEQVASRYEGTLSIGRSSRLDVQIGTGEGRDVKRFIEWNDGLLKFGAQTTVGTPGNAPNRLMVSMAYLIPPFSSNTLGIRDALYGDAKLAEVSYLNLSKQGGVLIGRKNLNGEVELVTPKGVDETVIDVSQATRIALDETRAAAARLGLA